jgi:CubicO group peptidase (beta-lactamase class C family)
METSDILEARHRIARYVKDSRDHFHLPLLTVGMMVDSCRLEMFEGAEDSTPPLLYKVGSLTKFVTALAVLKLQEDGVLRLEDPISQHLPWFNSMSNRLDNKPVTVLELLLHTSGLPRGDYLTENPSASQIQQMVQNSELPLQSAATHHFKYSNLGYVVLGTLIEAVSQEPYASFVKRRLFSPLGMVSSGFGNDIQGAMTTPQGLSCFSLSSATPYDLAEIPLLPAPYASHDMFSTVQDFSRLLLCVLNGGMHEKRRIFDAASISTLLDTSHAINSRVRAGLGFHVVNAYGGTTIFENGEHFGHSASMLVIPDKGFALVAMTNRGSAALNLSFILGKIARHSLKTGGAGPGALDHAYHDAASVTGNYTASVGADVAITEDATGLQMSVDNGKAVALEYMGQERFQIRKGTFAKYVIRLDRDQSSVRGLCVGPLYFRRKPCPDYHPRHPEPHDDKVGIYLNPEAGRVAVFERDRRLILVFSPFKEAMLESVSSEVFIQRDGPYERERVVFDKQNSSFELGRLTFKKTAERY